MPDRDPPAACELCSAPLPSARAERFAGMWLCPDCHLGKPGLRLNARGIGLQAIDYKAGPLPAESRLYHDYTLVTGAVPYELGVQAEISREDLFAKLGKLFRREVEVGEALFDRDVFVRSATPEQTRKLLQHEALQTAVHHAVTELRPAELPLRIENNVIRLSNELSGTSTPAFDLYRMAAVLVHGLASFAAEAGLQPRAELVALPDLEYFAAHLRPPLLRLGISGGWLPSLKAVVDFVRSLKNCRALESFGVHHLRLDDPDLAPVLHLPWLKSLALVGLANLRSVSALGSLSSLTTLNLTACPVDEMGFLEELEQLEVVILARTAIQSLAPLRRHRHLKRVSLRETCIADVTPLGASPDLEELDLRASAVADLGPLLGCTRLKQVWVEGSQLRPEQLRALREASPQVHIDKESE